MASDLIVKIIKQVEYYFGDVNFNHDKFLKDQSGKEDGWIPIKTLLTFNRLKALTEKDSDVVEAFENANSEIVELNETKDKLRRLKPLPEIDDEFKQNYKQRVVHLRGFPKEGTTLDDLIEYCSQYGVVESVQMRRYNSDKKFKGCCFAVFKDVESANKAVSSNDKFKGEHELNLRENKEDYFKRKDALRGKKKDKLIDSNADENKEDEDNADESKTVEGDKKEAEEKVEEEVKFESGLVIKLSDLPEKIHFTDIKPKLCEMASVQFVDIFPETHTAIVRFASLGDRDIILKTMGHVPDAENKQQNDKNGDSANKVEDVENEDTTEQKNDEKTVENEEVVADTENTPKEETNGVKNNEKTESKFLKISDKLIVKYQIIQGDEEKEYWTKIRKLASNKNHSSRAKGNFKKKRFGGYGGNRYNKNKRPANGDRDNAKKARTEA